MKNSAIAQRQVVQLSANAFNPLPNDNFFSWSESNELADDKINVTEKLKFVSGRVENTVRKGENAGYQHFLLFLHCFKGLLSQGR